MPGTVLIVDDHARFRASARRLLESDGWQVVGEAHDGAGALRETARLAPDVVLLDIGLPDASGLAVSDEIHRANPRQAVVLTSTHAGADYDQLAGAHGARGFLSKTELCGAALARLTR